MKQDAKDLGRWKRQILGHPLSDANDQIQAGLIQDTWSKCYLLLFQIQDHLSCHVHISTSPPASTLGSSCHCNSTMMAQELQFSEVDEFSTRKNLAPKQQPLDIIYSGSVLVWSKKKDVTKEEFSFTKISSTETRGWLSSRQTCLHGFLPLLPLKSLVLNSNSLIVNSDTTWSSANHRIFMVHTARNVEFKKQTEKMLDSPSQQSKW